MVGIATAYAFVWIAQYYTVGSPVNADSLNLTFGSFLSSHVCGCSSGMYCIMLWKAYGNTFNQCIMGHASAAHD